MLTRSRLGRSIGEQAARVFPIYLAPPGNQWVVPHTISLGPLNRRTSHTRFPHLPSSTRELRCRGSHDLAWAAQSENKPCGLAGATELPKPRNIFVQPSEEQGSMLGASVRHPGTNHPLYYYPEPPPRRRPEELCWSFPPWRSLRGGRGGAFALPLDAALANQYVAAPSKCVSRGAKWARWHNKHMCRTDSRRCLPATRPCV